MPKIGVLTGLAKQFSAEGSIELVCCLQVDSLNWVKCNASTYSLQAADEIILVSRGYHTLDKGSDIIVTKHGHYSYVWSGRWNSGTL